MKSFEIRKQFIDFFKEKEHPFIRSSPVVPLNDPTLLFANAGMNQFKDIFLGNRKPDFNRAVNSQKCIRVSGKHNDLEEVGVDNFHHTFFEMLGNWSFGDYYKQDSINWAWELFTKHWNLDVNRLWVTVYKDDDESYDIWRKVRNISNDRILRFGDKDNFWEMGDTGPCGPCSEIHYYTGSDLSKQNPHGVNCEQDYRELWNLVFIQYNRDLNGALSNLPMKHVDTGMGLERITSVMNNTQDHYCLDLFHPIINKIENISNIIYNNTNGTPHRVISDHLRMLCFSMADGAIPSNDGRGYVLRRVLRRAVRYGDLIGIKNCFLSSLVDSLISTVDKFYPEIKSKKDFIVKTLDREEDLFRNTLEKGLVKFDEIALKSNKKFSGRSAFKLYDTYGFPFDLTKLLCSEKNMQVNENEFKEEMEKQKIKSKKLKKDSFEIQNIDWISKTEKIETNFIGYNCFKADCNMLAYCKISDKYYIVLDQTPFYCESGGQVSDRGKIYNKSIYLDVLDVQNVNGVICHICNLKKGSLNFDISEFKAEIIKDDRKKIRSNHTATHLLHESLKQVLGRHVQQSGSLVDKNRLRFDYTHSSKLSDLEIYEIERIVNQNIINNIKLETNVENYKDAIENGVVALFGEKYEDIVRVVNISDFSKELCGGTHVARTGEIGFFKILSDSALSSGVRRIEAATGISSVSLMSSYYEKIKSLKSLLGATEDSLVDTVKNLITKNLEIEKKNERLLIEKQQKIIEQLIKKIVTFKNVKILSLVIKEDIDENILSDWFRKKTKNNSIMLVGLIKNSRPIIVCSLTDDLIPKLKANEIIKIAAKCINGGGGGKNHFAKAGGKDVKLLDKAIKITKDEVLKKI
ncbi:MAG: alanine--tRNA ligase [Candidatus Marinimicrobia bacterium]|nr:alanine--tRNA ligase [Candidatus Neomarinimicrobiota bacterium]|tara:strand:+ start:3548 stop:6127 length:2580 start_codon:yes stop_codon:yes gene_type:complete